MFHMVSFLFSDVFSRVPLISTNGESTYNEWVQGSKIFHFTMFAPNSKFSTHYSYNLFPMSIYRFISRLAWLKLVLYLSKINLSNNCWVYTVLHKMGNLVVILMPNILKHIKKTIFFYSNVELPMFILRSKEMPKL